MDMFRGGLILATAMALNGCGGGSDGPRTYAVGGDISGLVGSRLALSNNGVTASIAPGVNGRAPGLFAGLSKGASYEVTVVTQPTTPSQNCVVTNGKGTIADSDVYVSISCSTTPARYLLTEDGEQGCIIARAIDGATGTLVAGGSTLCDPKPFRVQCRASGPPRHSMIVDPQGRFFYMAIPGGQIGSYCTFAIDRDTGAVSFVQGISAIRPDWVAIDSSGRFLFRTSVDIGFSGFDIATNTIDPVSGLATFSSVLTFDGTLPGDMSVDPLGRFVYIIYGEPYSSSNPQPQRRVVALTFDPINRSLSRSAPPIVLQATGLAVHPSGRFLYAWNYNTIALVNVDPATGVLTPAPGSPVVTGDLPSSSSLGVVAIDPSGNYLYAFERVSNSILAYAIDRSSGRLASINGSPFPTAASPTSVAIEPQGRFMYVANALGVSAYEIDSANGALTSISGSPLVPAPVSRIALSN
jgi:6-phosphogluconolactonase (cycloisomerase 2 family)